MLQAVNQSISLIEKGVNFLTFGSYSDLSSLLTPSTQEPSAAIFASILVVVKWFLLLVAIFIFWKIACDKLGFTAVVALALTGASVMAILLFYNTPMHDFDVLQSRASGFIHAFNNESTNYTPSLIQPLLAYTEMPINFTNNTLMAARNAVPGNITVPVIQSNGALPSISSTSVNTSWVGWLIYLLLIALSIYIISRFSKLLAGLVAFIIFGLAINLPDKTIACTIIIVVCAALVYVLIGRFTILAAYPAAIIMLTLAYMLQPPQYILLTLLTSSLILSLLPVFYAFGYILYAAGEIVEGRQKLGLKTKPKKVIDEVYGQWDVNAVAVVLTLLFVVITILFGISLQGLGTFLAITAGLLKM